MQVYLSQLYNNLFPWTSRDFQVNAQEVILPSGESTYESNFSKQINAELQANSDYRYSAARFPNPKNYVLPFYNRNDIYSQESNGPLFSTNPNLDASLSNNSTLTGLPMELVHTNMSEQRRNIKQFDLLPGSYSTRKFENLSGNSELYFPKTEVAWGDFHDTSAQFANGTPVYPDSFLDRAKENFSEQREGTNLLPVPQISVSAPKADVTRIMPRTVDDLRTVSRPKISELAGRTYGEANVDGGALTWAPLAPMKRPKNETYDYSTGVNLDTTLGGQFWKPKNQKKPRTKIYNKNYVGNGIDNKINRTILSPNNTKRIPKKKQFTYTGNSNVTQKGVISRNSVLSRDKIDTPIAPYIGNAHYNSSLDSEMARNSLRENKKNTMSGTTEFITDKSLNNTNDLFYSGISDVKNKFEQIGRINMGGLNSGFGENTSGIDRTHRTELSDFSRILNTPGFADTYNRNVIRSNLK